MALDLYAAGGTPLEQQLLNWRDLAWLPISKLDDHAFTRVRVLLMSALEAQALQLAHALAPFEPGLGEALARLRRVELQQALAVRSLLGVDHSSLELAVAHKQCAVEVGAALAQREGDTAVGAALRFTVVEDLDHLYRLAAALDRVEGKDANNILQGHTAIACGRPTILQHRAAQDDLLRRSPAGALAAPASVHLLTMLGCAGGDVEYFGREAARQADPVVRQLYAEIACVGEQHRSHYASLFEPGPSPLGRLLLQQAAEALAYHACAQQEGEPRVKALWESMLDFEIGQFQFVADLLRSRDREDPQRLIGRDLDTPLAFASQREFVRQVLRDQMDLSCAGGVYVSRSQESRLTRDWRARVNAEGSPSEALAAGYAWYPGTELARWHPGTGRPAAMASA